MASSIQNTQTLDIKSSSVSSDPKSTAMSAFHRSQEMYDGDLEKMGRLSLKDQVLSNPRIKSLINKVEEADSRKEKLSKTAEALLEMEQVVTEFLSYAHGFSSPAEKKDDIFERKTSDIQTTDSHDSRTYVDVEASPIAASSAFDVSVLRLATKDIRTIGAESKHADDAFAVKNHIDSWGGTLEDLKSSIEDMLIAKNAHNQPANPLARKLYDLVVTGIANTSAPFEVKAQCSDLFDNFQDISSGFIGLHSSAVQNSVPGFIQKGEYILFSDAGKITTASNVFRDLKYTKEIIDQVTDLPGNPTPGDIQTIIDNIIIVPEDKEGANPSTRFPLALEISNALKIAADGVKTAEDIIDEIDFSLEKITEKIQETFNKDVPGSPEANNRFTQEIQKAFNTAISSDGADIDSINELVEHSYSSFIEAITIDLEEDDTLTQVLEKINATTEKSGVKASTIEMFEGNYLLQITSEKTGESNRISFFASSDELFVDPYDYSLKFNELIAHNVSQLDSPVNSGAIINGINVERSSNNFDISEGVNLTLKKINSEGKSQSISITEDNDLITSYLGNLVTRFNLMAKTLASQTARDSSTGLPLDSSHLSNTSTALALGMDISAITTFKNKSGLSLRDLGIELIDTYDDGVKFLAMQLDDAKFREQLRLSPQKVREFFSKKFETTNIDFKVSSYGESFKQNQLDYKISIDVSGAIGGYGPANKKVQIDILDSLGNITSTEYYDLQASAGGHTIKITDLAHSSSPLFGLSFRYNSDEDADGDTAITSSITQGFGAYAYSRLIDKTQRTAIGGSILEEAKELGSKNSDIVDQIKKDSDRLESLKEMYSNIIGSKMARAEQARLKAKMMQDQIDSQIAVLNGG